MSIILNSVNTKSFLPHNKNIVTFKDLRKIITESQKLDDDKMPVMITRLRLWPAGGNGNGNGGGNNNNNNNNNAWRSGWWKGRPIISDEYWKKLAGYTDLDDVLTEDEQEQRKWTLDFVENIFSQEVWDRINAQMIKEINPRALHYFPNDAVAVVFKPSYSCPKAPDIYKEWISDYEEYLTAKGYKKHEWMNME